MLGLNYTEEEIQGMISEIDVDGDGDLDFDGEPARLLILLATSHYGLVDMDINASLLLKIQWFCLIKSPQVELPTY